MNILIEKCTTQISKELMWGSQMKQLNYKYIW